MCKVVNIINKLREENEKNFISMLLFIIVLLNLRIIVYLYLYSLIIFFEKILDIVLCIIKYFEYVL